MELFTLLDGIPYVRVGKQFVRVVDILAMCDSMVDGGFCGPDETDRHALHRSLLDWHRTGELPHGETA